MVASAHTPELRPGSPRTTFRASTPSRLGWILLILTLLGGSSARAELQFDVFLGLDDRVREGSWFPIAFEILNDGPAFTGTVVVGSETGFDAQQRRFTIELPTGTRKRTVLPVFPSGGRYSRWEARLLDANGKVVAERSGLQPKDVAPQVPILGALPRTFGGLPTLPEVPNRGPEFVPGVARLQAEYLPSNPIALEGITAWYLNSEKAADLKEDQADALLAWLHAGGHLIVAIEQPTDVTALAWLRDTLPFAPESVANQPNNGQFDEWLKSGKTPIPTPTALQPPTLPQNAPPQVRQGRRRQNPNAAIEASDPFRQIEPSSADFQKADFPVVRGRILDGESVFSLGQVPLVISAPRGRGTITVLAFSPEREPFRSWKNRPWFWARLTGVAPELLTTGDLARWGGSSIDGLFGAMLDSRQVRKLPIAALLALLVVYLAVIGPIDQWVLKRLGRQMWTWITFPIYVVVFSGLIYFIGYRLRAGELEWNELQVVDQLPRKEGSAMRGRTWISIYSPQNARYRIASEQPFSTFRAELQQGAQGRADTAQLTLKQGAKGFDAEAFIPVWVNQLYASDWLDPRPAILEGKWREDLTEPTVIVENKSDTRFTQLKAAYNGRIYTLGDLPPRGQIEIPLAPEGGQLLDDAVAALPGIHGRVQQRRFAFGTAGSGEIERNLEGVVLASFVERLRSSPNVYGESFAANPGLDVNRLIVRGDVVIFAWAPDTGIAAPIHRFTPTRLRRDTVVRFVIPAGRPS